MNRNWTCVLLIVAATGTSTAPADAGTAYRITDISLRDPHIYVSSIFCFDVTDMSFMGFSFNQTIADLLQNDGDSDGFLDASPILYFPVLDQTGGGIVQLGEASCTAPMASTQCVFDTTTFLTAAYSNIPVGTCLSTLPGTVVHSYSPAVASVSSPCFVAAVGAYVFDIGGIPISMSDVQIAGRWIGNPATGLNTGLIRGFVSQAVADATLIPPSLPLIGGLTLTSLLPGGPGNCSSYSDQDTGLDGTTPGWWFYFNFIAIEVPYTQPNPVRKVTWGQLRAMYRDN